MDCALDLAHCVLVAIPMLEFGARVDFCTPKNAARRTRAKGSGGMQACQAHYPKHALALPIPRNRLLVNSRKSARIYCRQ